MTVTVGNWVRWSITLLLTILHGSVAVFIFVQIRNRHKLYSSSFYVLYLIIAFADISTIINNFLAGGIILFESLKPWFFEHPTWDTVTWLVSGYMIFLQCCTHTAIAINRTWISFQLVATSVWLPKLGKKLIWLLFLLPFPMLSVRFAGHSIYFYDDDGELASSYIEQYVMVYHVTAAITVIVTSSSICFILAIITIFRYRILYKEYGTLSPSNKQDLLLFGQAFVSLVLQMALVGYQIMRFIGGYYNLPGLQAFALIYFYYVNDAFSLVSPISLLMICKFIRKDFIDFIIGKETKGTNTLSWT